MKLGNLNPSTGQTDFGTNGKQVHQLESSICPARNMVKRNPVRRTAYMASRDDFRAARTRCALACEQYNQMSEDAATEERLSKWLKIVDPDNKIRCTTAVAFSDIHRLMMMDRPSATSSAVVADDDDDDEDDDDPDSDSDHDHDDDEKENRAGNKAVIPQKSPPALDIPRPTFPYIKQPVYIDYGLRLHIAPTTFINRNCYIMDTPVADITIGERCMIGPNVSIIGIGHPVRYEDRNEFETGRAGSWGAKVEVCDGVWIGAGVTILPGVTVGEYSTIAAGSIVTKDIPPRCMAAGNPATVRYFIGAEESPTEIGVTAMTLEEALKIGRGG